MALRLYSVGSVVEEHRLSCSPACGIFPDQGSNLCLLHWQVDSYPLHHQGSLSALTSIWLLIPVWNQIQKGGRKRGFPTDSDGKESACNARDLDSNPGSRWSPEEGNVNLLQYFCLEIPWIEESFGLKSMRLQRVRHIWVTRHTHTHTLLLQGIHVQFLVMELRSHMPLGTVKKIKISK